MTQSRIAVIGAPVDLGQGRRGVDMGPSALRVAGLGKRLEALGYTITDLGNIEVPQAETLPEPGTDDKAHYLSQIAEACELLGLLVASSLDKDCTPLVIGGDHSIAVGTVAGLSQYHRRFHREIGLLWIDAHADMNTPESSPSGNVHGMPLACCIGRGPEALAQLLEFSPKVDPSHVVIVGLRDVDEIERGTVKGTGVRAFTMREIDERGMSAVMEEAIVIASRGVAGFHLSLDMDAVDPQYAPGVGTPVRGGLTYREAHLAMEKICDSERLLSMEVVEVNPAVDEKNRTADLAVELVLSAMGKRIL